MKKFLLYLSVFIGFGSLTAMAQNQPATTGKPKCTSNPCGNTATGEDPQEQRIREAAARTAKILAGADDQRRWESVSLYSDSTKPDELKMPVVKAVGLEMQLDPKLGHLSFTKQGWRQNFVIASPLGEKKSICPRYVIDVVEASAAHALVRMSCLKTEYSPGRYHMSVEYYLYDAETAVMRNIWLAAIGDKTAHMPDAKPTPALKVLPSGYRFDWSGIQPSDSPPSTTTIHNTYIRTAQKSGETELLCTDLSAPKGQGIEDEMCEGGVLPVVTEKRTK